MTYEDLETFCTNAMQDLMRDYAKAEKRYCDAPCTEARNRIQEIWGKREGIRMVLNWAKGQRDANELPLGDV